MVREELLPEDNYGKVKKQFDEKRDAAYRESEKRRRELRLASEEYKSIDDEINKCLAELMHIMQELGKDQSKRIMAIKSEMKLLREKRDEITVKMGYPKGYEKTRFECEKCEDTGFIGIDVCECFKRALRMESYLSSGLGKALIRQKFENFDINMYDGEHKKSMEEIYSVCLDYAENFQKDGPSLLFIGGTGLGKTHLSSALAMKVLDKGFDVVYDTAQSLFSAFEKNRFNRNDTETPKFLSCDLLIIDDLGSEISSQSSMGTLYNVLNARMNSELPTVISTNLSPADMKEKYDSRIISRLFGQFKILPFVGTDIRMKKLMMQ